MTVAAKNRANKYCPQLDDAHIEIYEEVLNQVFTSLCYKAKERNLIQNLSKDQVHTLGMQNCHYCGKSPSRVILRRTNKYLYNGIDRIDSTKGYTIDNVVSCCKACNFAKRVMSSEQFSSLISTIYTTLVIQKQSPAHYMSELSSVPDKELPKSPIHTLVAEWKRGARLRNKSWQLTDAQAAWLSKQPCFYCGKTPSQLRKRHIYSGIDRIDNTKGYQIDNVVPCCRDCNFAKKAMTFDQFKDWVTAVYLHWVLPNNATTTVTAAADSQSPSKTALASVLPPS
jgi:hypothetical protein